MSPKRFFYFLCGVMVLLAAGIGYGFYYETGRLKTEKVALAKKAADATVASEKLDQLSQLKRQFAELQPVLTKLNMALPSQKDQSEVVLQIEQLAANAGMTLPSASFQNSTGLPSATSQTVKAGDALALPISFQLSGSYDQLQTFLQQLERLGRYSNVSSLAISRNGSKLSFGITLNVYVKP